MDTSSSSKPQHANTSRRPKIALYIVAIAVLPLLVLLSIPAARQGPDQQHQQQEVVISEEKMKQGSQTDQRRSPYSVATATTRAARSTTPSGGSTHSSPTLQALLKQSSTKVITGEYKESNWARQATIEDSEGVVNATLSVEEQRGSILEVPTTADKMRARAEELWTTHRVENASGPFKRCIGTRTWLLHSDSHLEWHFNHLAALELGGVRKRFTAGPFFNKPKKAGYLAKVYTRYMETDTIHPDERTLDSIFNPWKRKENVRLDHITDVMVGTGAWHVLINNTHPYDLYWRIRHFVRYLRTKLKGVTITGYLPHYYQPPRSFRRSLIPCAAEWRILAIREASLAAYVAEKVDWIVDAWHLTKAHPDSSDNWGHHYYEKMTYLVQQDIMNTIFKCDRSDLNATVGETGEGEEQTDTERTTGNGKPGDGGHFFDTGPKVARIFKPHQVKVNDRFVKPGSNPEDGVEDRDAAEGARVPWPMMRICECHRNPFYETCDLLLPYSGLGRNFHGTPEQVEASRWRVARRYCELGKKQLESSGALPVRPLDQTRRLSDPYYYNPNAKPLTEPATATAPYSPFPFETLVDTAKHLTTADHWDHFIGLACEARHPSMFGNCAMTIGGDTFRNVNNWNYTDPSRCSNLLGSSKPTIKAPSAQCPSIKRACANNGKHFKMVKRKP